LRNFFEKADGTTTVRNKKLNVKSLLQQNNSKINCRNFYKNTENIKPYIKPAKKV